MIKTLLSDGHRVTAKAIPIKLNKKIKQLTINAKNLTDNGKKIPYQEELSRPWRQELDAIKNRKKAKTAIAYLAL
ncbi:hypothetical protein [Azomonas macrocytogenes]|uniref:Uncharacterized protein n=1 Tax=Azomonas macrocytogenes TaxID=69962 RepID=A0A839TAD3_AZOMA|nr:hypothetical protein [Azomonas macrocytogenes]MBB3104995.1 hypothetical protein [Azomonas macrocytogenes]